MENAASLSAEDRQLTPTRILLSFVAGFIAVLAFHQGMLELLHIAGISRGGSFPMKPIPPFGVPQVWSYAFWGGVWGIVFAAIERRLPGGSAYWIGAILFGAIFPTLVAWFVVLPLKGLPAAGGFQFPGILVGPLVNGAWGFGTAFLYRGAVAVAETRTGRRPAEPVAFRAAAAPGARAGAAVPD